MPGKRRSVNIRIGLRKRGCQYGKRIELVKIFSSGRLRY
jgi:hypothetical protein